MTAVATAGGRAARHGGEGQAGYHVAAWCRSVGIGRATFYVLAPHLRPRSVLLGGRRLIIEAPAAYLQRVAAMQAGGSDEEH